MHAIYLIHHRKCSCQHNQWTTFNTLLFTDGVTIHQFAAVDMYANVIIHISQLFAFPWIVCSRDLSAGASANYFCVLLSLKPFSDGVDLFLNWQGLRNTRTSNEIIVTVCIKNMDVTSKNANKYSLLSFILATIEL